MLELIRAASGCKRADLEGKLIARAEVCIRGKEKDVPAFIEVSRPRLAVVNARGMNNSMSLFLMPAGNGEASGSSPIPDGCEELFITREELEEYLLLSGDTNPIHTGKHPVIPGLLILMRVVGCGRMDICARFYAPAYIGERLFIKREEDFTSVYGTRGEIIKITGEY